MEPITGPVFINSFPAKLYFLNKQGASVDCVAHGTPQPTIIWLRHSIQSFDDDSQLPVTREDSPEVQVLRNGTLVFRPFQNEHFIRHIHATTYTCRASNFHGTVVSTTVIVRATSVRQEQGEQVQAAAHVYDSYAIDGNVAVLKCHMPTFFSEQLQVVGWIREDNLIIKPNQTGMHYSVLHLWQCQWCTS